MFCPIDVPDTLGSATGTLPPRPASAWNATWTDRLKRDLLLNYDKFARPAQHTNTTVVKLDLTLRHISLVSFFLHVSFTQTNWITSIVIA